MSFLCWVWRGLCCQDQAINGWGYNTHSKLRCPVCLQIMHVLESHVSMCWDWVGRLKPHKRGRQTSLDIFTWQGQTPDGSAPYAPYPASLRESVCARWERQKSHGLRTRRDVMSWAVWSHTQISPETQNKDGHQRTSVWRLLPLWQKLTIWARNYPFFSCWQYTARTGPAGCKRKWLTTFTKTR